MKCILPLLVLPFVIHGPLQAQGVSAPWDISQTVQALREQAGKLTPVLQQLTPQEWETKGAPPAYTAQWHSAQDEVGYLLNAANALERQPEKLSLALETLFRMQAVESEVGNLVDAARRYQDPAMGDLLVSVVAANSTNRDQLRQYITDLAKTKEQEFRIVDEEAQRCRGTLVRQTPSRPASSSSRPAAAK